MGNFLPFYPFSENPKNQNFENNENNCWRYHHFTHVYQKPQLYEVQFPRYRVSQTKKFIILGHFLPFYPPNNLKNQNFEKNEKVSFYISVPKIMIICYMLLEIWSATDTIFCCFGSFFALLSHYIDPEKKL